MNNSDFNDGENILNNFFNDVGEHAASYDDSIAVAREGRRAAEAAIEYFTPSVYTDRVVPAGDNAGAIDVGNKRSSGFCKKIWVSTIAIFMCLIILLSILGAIIYFATGDRTIDTLEVPTDGLRITQTDYHTLSTQEFFVPNLSNFSHIQIWRGTDVNTDETIMFIIEGRFDGSTVTVRIITDESHTITDEAYFLGGNNITVEDELIRVNSILYEGGYFHRAFFVIHDIDYFVSFRSDDSGAYSAVLEALLEPRLITGQPDRDVILTEIDFNELKQHETFTFDFDTLDNIAVWRGEEKETGRLIMFAIEADFGGSKISMRSVVCEFYTLDDIALFGGANSTVVTVRGYIGRVNYVMDGSQYLYRLFFFGESMVRHYVELTTRTSGEYSTFLHAIIP